MGRQRIPEDGLNMFKLNLKPLNNWFLSMNFAWPSKKTTRFVHFASTQLYRCSYRHCKQIWLNRPVKVNLLHFAPTRFFPSNNHAIEPKGSLLDLLDIYLLYICNGQFVFLNLTQRCDIMDHTNSCDSSLVLFFVAKRMPWATLPGPWDKTWACRKDVELAYLLPFQRIITVSFALGLDNWQHAN